MKVTVIDYGLSNLLSVERALTHLGAQVEITSQIVYGDLDRVFHIEENIRRLHDAEYEAEMAEERSDDEE